MGLTVVNNHRPCAPRVRSGQVEKQLSISSSLKVTHTRDSGGSSITLGGSGDVFGERRGRGNQVRGLSEKTPCNFKLCLRAHKKATGNAAGALTHLLSPEPTSIDGVACPPVCLKMSIANALPETLPPW